MKEKVITCLHCGNKTSMKVVASHDLVEHEEIWDHSVNHYQPAYITSFFKQWDMYLCPVCTEITVQRITSFSEETEPNGKPIKYIDLIFPSGSSENKHLPPPVRDAFEAALKVRNLDGAVCIMALRRTLEKMCKHKNAKGKDLFTKLKDLQSENILPPIMEGISYILRKEGNSAAHADDTEFSSETVKLMIEFTEVILDYVYSLPEKIEQAQLRLNKETISQEKSEG
ncbi:DUF4145 domain-containing protein [Paenibacillus sp. J2TS4]|uniref:DUF4145 domain-containing protein n=1 Tax=Paenibacillus sp. J2TS4 TaxID=2807194 RepID=UPI001B287A8C|nr:DUF4145 domain-containing protein [Paenibacillus sp. J2TS4]GIP33620.1 hypothetical protein J2TS4_28300 [Paenibacillus sp. J2TS4]